VSEIDQQFIEYVVKSLVGKPDAVHIDRRIDEKGVLLELTVDPEDLGRVIGKRGATAQSLRTLLRALGTKNDARYNLKIVDNGVGDHEHHSSSQPQSTSSPQSNDDSVPEPSAKSDEDQVSATVPDPTPEPELEKETEDDQTSDRLRQTREELSDLDDLDI
jgi:predicted RNA-binding protein YlqC (UPF0109 family)